MKTDTNHHYHRRPIFLWLLCLVLALQHLPGYAFQDKGRIAGRVTDQLDHTPLPGVNVRIKGSNKGTVTDGTGQFFVPAKAGDVLVLTYVGYENKELTLTGVAEISISMTKSNQDLNEVLVVGYGTQT